MAFIPFFRVRDTCSASEPEHEYLSQSLRDYAADTSLWMELYRGNAPWCLNDRRSLSLPSLIASEIARLVTVEAQIIVGDGENAAFIDSALDGLRKRLRRTVELACAGGGVALLPVLSSSGDKILTSVFGADMLIPLRFDEGGNPISMAVCSYADTSDGRFYRVETHILENGGVIVTNRAVKSELGGILPLIGSGSTNTALSDIQQWSDIEPRTVYAGTDDLLMSYFALPSASRDPMLNTGSSIYSRAVSLINEADAQFKRLLWEFEGGELAIDVSEDLFRRTKAGLQLPAGRERLFRPNLIDSSLGEPMKTFSPALRDEALTRGLDTILMRIEDVCGLSRGTISSLTYADRTATEIMDTKQRLYSTVTDIQKMLTEAIKSYTRSLTAFGRIHGLCGDEAPQVDVIFGDSIIEDGATNRAADLEEVRAGVMTAEEFRKKWKIQ